MIDVIVISLLAVVAGVPMAWAYGEYLRAVQQGRAWSASAWDFVIIMISHIVTLTIWDIADRHILVLIGYAVGSVIGTFLVVRKNCGETIADFQNDPTSQGDDFNKAWDAGNACQAGARADQRVTGKCLHDRRTD